MTTLCVIQARLGSTRLPQKCLATIGDRTMLQHVLARAQMIPGVDAVVLTTPPEDKALLCPPGLPWVAHQPPNVLSGFVAAARMYDKATIVRITGDTPLLLPEVAERAIKLFKKQDVDYFGTTRPTLVVPDGWDIEVISRGAIMAAHRHAMGIEREHVTSYIWSQPERFKLGQSEPWFPDWALKLKASVDTEEDLAYVRRLMRRMDGKPHDLPSTIQALKEQCDAGVDH